MSSRSDPERGLRGVMSAILILEGVTLLLGLTVIQHGGTDAPAAEIIVISVLAVGHVAACGIMAKRYAVAVIVALQVLVIGCWVISAAIGITGIIFAAMWAGVLYMRREFRRRLAAGTIPPQ